MSREKVSTDKMEFGQPVPTAEGRWKYRVLVWDPHRQRGEIVRFGDRRYEDFTQHHDWARRASFLRRSAGIRDGEGRLTAGNPLSASYWSRRYLWASGEPYVDVRPPASGQWG